MGVGAVRVNTRSTGGELLTHPREFFLRRSGKT